MDITDNKLSPLFDTLVELRDKGCFYQYAEDTEINGRTMDINGRKLLNFANCSYLGLEIHPLLKEGAIQATKTYGTLFAYSRAIVSSKLYIQLEDLLNQIYPGYIVVAPTTTLGHCSTFPLLIQKEDAIILDTFAHNSMFMASQLCKANGTFEVMCKHNDMEHLKYLIHRLKKDKYKNIWYCADGVYSMQGDLAPLKEIKKILDEEEQFYSIIDDAHGVTWTGKYGSGYALGDHDLHPKMIVAASLAKSFGSCGVTIVFPNKEWAELVRSLGHGLVYSGPISPPILGAAIASAKLHLSDELVTMQNELMCLIKYYRRKSIELGLPLKTKYEVPIQMFNIGNQDKTCKILEELMAGGYFATGVLYPAVPECDSGLRISITLHHKKEDLDCLLIYLKKLFRKYSII